MQKKSISFSGMVKSFGLVFGDIGTSPIYTLTVIFLILKPTQENVIGVLSLILWTLVLLVTVQYVWLAMSLSMRGEGGTIVLQEILVRFLKPGKAVAAVTLMSYIGISLIIGDGVITPAISILSAVEGMLLIPGLGEMGRSPVILISCGIAVALFAFQRHGTEKVAGAFGPLMLLWFAALTLSGIYSIAQVPAVVDAVNPLNAASFLYRHGIVGFFVLSEVILCATGGEALYADMGHLGREPIAHAWYFVFFALAVNYLGQGAFVISHPGTKNVLFEMVFSQARVLYVPFLILSMLATVIASQAMISGMFSIVYQGISTRVMPLLRIHYTSAHRQSQIYLPFVNWSLLIAVLYVMYSFRESSKLAAAYGFAVTGTMTLTGIMMTLIFYYRKQLGRMAVCVLVALVSSTFFVSNLYKIPHGGYWSIIIAAFPFCTILLYRAGQRRLYEALRPLPLDTFLTGYSEIYQNVSRIKGTALFFARDEKEIPPYIVHTIFMNNIIYEDNIIVPIVRRGDPFGATGYFKSSPAPGLRVFEIQIGYMEIPDIEGILSEAGINPKTIFYGVEDIQTSLITWKIFSIIKRLTPNIVQFYQLPYNKLHGVVTRVLM